MAKTTRVSRRAAGAGRKPRGNFRGNTEAISLRVNREWLGRIDAEAKAGNKSRTQMIMEAGTAGLELIHKREQPRPLRALGWLVQYLADECSISIAGRDEQFNWNTDKSVFRAFEITLSYLLDELRPKGESNLKEFLASTDMHDDWRQYLSSPEEVAKHVFFELWDELKHVEPNEKFGSDEVLSRFNEIAREEILKAHLRSYSLKDVRRDLDIAKGDQK